MKKKAILICLIILSLLPKIGYADIFKNNLDLSSTQTNTMENYFIKENYNKDAVNIKTYTDKVEIFTTNLYMMIDTYEFSPLFNNWIQIENINNNGIFVINNLKPYSYYKIRIYSISNFLGEFEFYTQPENIEHVDTELTEEKNIKLSWNNCNNFPSEIYKKELTEKNWYKVETTCNSYFVDTNVELEKTYQYKIRFNFENSHGLFNSNFTYSDNIYVAEDINNVILSNGYYVIFQNDPLNSTIPYPYKNNDKTIGTSGCGVCSSLMIIRHMTNFTPTLESYTNELLSVGARDAYGSNIYVIAQHLRSNYNLHYSFTRDIEVLKNNLSKGNIAIANVGANKMFTGGSGHFIVVAGIYKDETGHEKAIILDPSFSPKKYNNKKRKEAGISYTSDGIVVSDFETLLSDCKNEYFTIFSTINS